MNARDRVKESSTTTGTGNVTLAGAATGFVTLNTAHGLNERFNYYLLDGNGTAWEEGDGYLSASTTLVRDRIFKSTNANAAINLSANTHTIITGYGEAYDDEIRGLEIISCLGASNCY